MKIHLLVLLLLFSLITSSAFAVTLKGSCQIEFSGTTTLHDFSGRADCNPLTLSVTEGRTSEQGVELSEISVPVASMSSDNKKRDHKMHAMLEIDQFPQITGQPVELTPENIDKFLNGPTIEKEPFIFTLKIRDIAQQQTAQISRLQRDDTEVTFVLEFDLSLKDYQLKPPSIFGLIRAGDQVHLKVLVHLIKEKPDLRRVKFTNKGHSSFF